LTRLYNLSGQVHTLFHLRGSPASGTHIHGSIYCWKIVTAGPEFAEDGDAYLARSISDEPAFFSLAGLIPRPKTVLPTGDLDRYVLPARGDGRFALGNLIFHGTPDHGIPV